MKTEEETGKHTQHNQISLLSIQDNTLKIWRGGHILCMIVKSWIGNLDRDVISSGRRDLCQWGMTLLQPQMPLLKMVHFGDIGPPETAQGRADL